MAKIFTNYLQEKSLQWKLNDQSRFLVFFNTNITRVDVPSYKTTDGICLRNTLSKMQTYVSTYQGGYTYLSLIILYGFVYDQVQRITKSLSASCVRFQRVNETSSKLLHGICQLFEFFNIRSVLKSLVSEIPTNLNSHDQKRKKL